MRRISRSWKSAARLLMNAKIIIMDEPTTSLTDPEIEKVFAILRQLREQTGGHRLYLA